MKTDTYKAALITATSNEANMKTTDYPYQLFLGPAITNEGLVLYSNRIQRYGVGLLSKLGDGNSSVYYDMGQ